MSERYFIFAVPPNDIQIDDSGLPLGSVIDREFDKCPTLKNSISAGLQSSGIPPYQFLATKEYSFTPCMYSVILYCSVVTLGILCPTAPVNIPNTLNDPNSSQVSHFSPVTSPLLNSNFLTSRFQDPIDVRMLDGVAHSLFHLDCPFEN